MVSAIGKQGWATAPSQGCWLEEGARGRGPKGVGVPVLRSPALGQTSFRGRSPGFPAFGIVGMFGSFGSLQSHRCCEDCLLYGAAPSLPSAERAVHRGLLGKPEAVHRLRSLQTGPLERRLTASASPSTVLPCGPRPPLSRAGQADPACFQELEGRVSVLGETKEKPSSQMAT